ncbi:MmpS family transport accessory protein [Saccharothrix sp. Mg75]|uniref:MmpS family transport accessory protein n=1 Tax=Saccharothrix sp. Mg75 TaxID=3445357 RepID=UPI003EED42C3
MPEPERPARPRFRTWSVVAGAAALVIGAVALVLWTTRPVPPVRVVYEVRGAVERATVTYSTFQRDGTGTRREELTALPWRKELVVPDEPVGGVLTVTIGQGGGDVACEVTVDGVERRSATATGAHASALCDGF